MPRSLIPLTLLLLFAAALLAVPAAFAKQGPSRTIRGTCTQQSTSKLKLAREDRGIEVEFQVDQNRNGVPWKVALLRNGHRVASLRAVTHAPSGSFEIRRVIAGSGRISARAIRSGETCTASASARRSATTAGNNGAGHDASDDHGHDSRPDF
jgi:hypothetical protein